MPTNYHFEGVTLQALANAAKNATQFCQPYQQGQYTNEPAFWLVKDCGIYLISAHPNPEGQLAPLTADCKEELELADLTGDDYIEHIPVSRDQLDGLADGKQGLMVSLTTKHVVCGVYEM
jgi:hypothetical protein